MSASEKLKLLEAKIDGNAAHVAVLTMMDVLPQIVALVEAADRVRFSAGLDNELTALEEALE